jgi:hypothetical protein
MRNRLILQPKARGENDGPADAGANCGEAFNPHSPDDALSCAVRTPIQI